MGRVAVWQAQNSLSDYFPFIIFLVGLFSLTIYAFYIFRWATRMSILTKIYHLKVLKVSLSSSKMSLLQWVFRLRITATTVTHRWELLSRHILRLRNKVNLNMWVVSQLELTIRQVTCKMDLMDIPSNSKQFKDTLLLWITQSTFQWWQTSTVAVILLLLDARIARRRASLWLTLKLGLERISCAACSAVSEGF